MFFFFMYAKLCEDILILEIHMYIFHTILISSFQSNILLNSSCQLIVYTNNNSIRTAFNFICRFLKKNDL